MFDVSLSLSLKYYGVYHDMLRYIGIGKYEFVPVELHKWFFGKLNCLNKKYFLKEN